MIDPEIKELMHYPLGAALIAIAGWVGKHLIGHMRREFRRTNRLIKQTRAKVATIKCNAPAAPRLRQGPEDAA
jgi:hypothetical protein